MLLFIGLYSCFSNKYQFIGEKKVVNKESWRVKFYQLDEFEVFAPIRYEVVNENDSLIIGRHRLTGADANLQSVDKFYAKIQDSIFFVCYPYPKVVAIKHISNWNSSNQWGLIKKLHKYDTSLYQNSADVINKK